MTTVWYTLYAALFLNSFTPIPLTSGSIQGIIWTTQTHLFVAWILCPSLWQDFYHVHSLALHPFLPPSLPLLIPLSSPMVVSRQTHSQSAPDAPPAPPHPTACHCSLLCLIQTHGIAISTGFSLPVSASVSHTPHCLFCLPLSYPLPSEK